MGSRVLPGTSGNTGSKGALIVQLRVLKGVSTRHCFHWLAVQKRADLCGVRSGNPKWKHRLRSGGNPGRVSTPQTRTEKLVADAYFTEPQVAAALHVTPRTVRRWRMARRIPYERTPGGRIRYRLDDLIEITGRMRIERDA